MSYAGPSARLGLALAILPLVTAAQAADLDVTSRVEQVVVYPDAGSVTRVADVDLPAGPSTLAFHDLPLALDPASIRVEGIVSAAITIGSVEARLAPAPVANGVADEKLQDLRKQRAALGATLDALEVTKAMVIHFSQTGPDKLSAGEKPLEVAQWATAWEAVGQGLARVGNNLAAMRQQAQDLDNQISALEESDGRQTTPRLLGRDASVSLEAQAATKATIRITYRVAGARWSPAYDAHLTTEAGSQAALELVRRAVVSQQTGEDWRGVSLSVSTTRAVRGTQAPEVYTQRMAFWEAVEPAPLAEGRVARPAAPPALAAMRKTEDQVADAAPPMPAREQQATLDAGAWQASFQIPGAVDVPDDGSSRTFRVSTMKSSPDLVVRSAPALDESAYLQASIVNSEEAALLPGPVNVERDRVFVGVSRIGLIAPGDSADVGFGADDRVKVVRVPVRRKENDPTWFNSTKTEQREFKTTVKNLHPFPVKVSVVDQVPISETTAIVIEQLPSTTPPTDKNVGDRRGVLQWRFDLAANESKEIHLGYRMKWPADRVVTLESLTNNGHAGDGAAQ